ncbi:MAG: hypothetical protein F6K41_36050 [Symploca sp. SIO3E6]|nr:hypothetical protein [Caldora sp. SIO3E6]
MFGVISSSVEYLHFGCNKAEGSRAEGSKGRKKVAREKGIITVYPNLILEAIAEYVL